MTHFYRVKKFLPDRFKEECLVVCRGKGPGPRNALIEFADGSRAVVPRFAVRKLLPIW